jgi:enolase-phosphatase E1
VTRIDLRGRGHRALLLDIEGTTTPIAFVHGVLFPYARRRVREYLEGARHRPEFAEMSARLAVEHAEDLARGESVRPWQTGDDETAISAMADYALWLMDRDRKSPALKLLQGQIWEAGYQAGELRGDVFPDVAPALRRWRAAGLPVAIYSSGSELAQRRLFGSTPDDDLTPLLTGFFDTRMGAKTEAASYRAIASELGLDPTVVLFVSDVTQELDAARAAGLGVVLSLRPGNPPQPRSEMFEAIRSFDELEV